MTASTGQDVIAFLQDQHKQVKGMAGIDSASPAERAWLFDDLRRFLAAHEAAEEEVVHPRVRDNLRGHTNVVEDRLAEETEAAKAISKLEKLDPSSDDFATGFDKFAQDVIAHAQHEEHEELPALRDTADPAVIDEMMRTLQNVSEIAMGRGAVPQNDASFAAMLDSARTTFRRETNRG
jgi:hemerythrin superfamily protein